MKSFGPISIRPIGERRIEGEDISGALGIGQATAYAVSYREAIVEVLDIVWENGSQDVRASAVLHGADAVQTLQSGRLRLGVTKHPDRSDLSWCEIRLAKIKPGTEGWSSLCNGTAEELRLALGFDLLQHLMAIPSVEQVGTKSQVLGRTDPTKSRYCVIFGANDRSIPIGVFSATRIASLQNGTLKRA